MEKEESSKEESPDSETTQDDLAHMDHVMEMAGGFGRYQLIVTLIFAWVEVVSGMGNMLIVFMQYKPDFVCGNGSVPLRWGNGSSVCSEGCAFVYDPSLMTKTIVTDWDLVCGREWEVATAQMVHMLGILCGSAFVGPLADRLGRRHVLFLFLALQAVFTCAQALAPYYPLFLLFRFLAAVFMTGSWMTPFSYLGEVTTGVYRTMVTGFFFLPHAVGYALLSPLAYFTMDWRIMSVIVGALIVPVLPFFFWFLESPRWELARGKVAASALTLQTIARRNNRPLPKDWDLPALLRRISKTEGVERRESMLAILRYPRLIARSVLLILLWFVNNIVYYGVSLNITAFSGNLFVNNALFALVEIPSYALGSFLLRAGRKWAEMGLLLVTGVCLVSVAWLDRGPLSLALAVLGKLTISASFGVIYVFTAELYPTLVRNSGRALGSFLLRAGRKWVEMGLLLVTGVCLVSVAWLDRGPLSLALAVLGKLTISASFGVIYVFTAELYPTLVRNSGRALGSFLLRAGRKWVEMGLLLVTGVCLVSVAWLDRGPLSLALAVLGKLTISASFGVIYVFTAELYPTLVRNSGRALGSFLLRAGRKWAEMGLLLVTGVCLVSVAWLDRGPLSLALAVLGKLTISASFGVIYVFTAELYPTLVRNSGRALGSFLLWAGRKWAEMGLLLVTGVCLVSVAWLDRGPLSLALAVLGKLTISASFGVIYVFTAELYPTLVRNSGRALGSFLLRAGRKLAEMGLLLLVTGIFLVWRWAPLPTGSQLVLLKNFGVRPFRLGNIDVDEDSAYPEHKELCRRVLRMFCQRTN